MLGAAFVRLPAEQEARISGYRQVIATAILDRLLHHSTTLNIKGESYRLKDKRRAGLVTTPTTKEDETSHEPEAVPMQED
ncbi:hypothetical protein GCM10008997_15730 [Halomonas salifodinae]